MQKNEMPVNPMERASGLFEENHWETATLELIRPKL